MAKPVRFQLLRRYLWWWLPPVAFMVIAFVVLIVFANITDDAPFQYVIF